VKDKEEILPSELASNPEIQEIFERQAAKKVKPSSTYHHHHCLIS